MGNLPDINTQRQTEAEKCSPYTCSGTGLGENPDEAAGYGGRQGLLDRVRGPGLAPQGENHVARGPRAVHQRPGEYNT